MRPERDDLAAAAEYICLRLPPEELRSDYVSHLRNRRAWGDVPWDGFIQLALQALDDGATNLFMALLGAYLYDKFKKPDANVERLIHEQRAGLARLDEVISRGPDPRRLSLSDPAIAARVDDAHQKQIEIAHASREFHERVLIQVQDSDPAIASMVDDALRQLEARGAKALVDDVNAAGELPADSSGHVSSMRWWRRPE